MRVEHEHLRIGRRRAIERRATLHRQAGGGNQLRHLVEALRAARREEQERVAVDAAQDGEGLEHELLLTRLRARRDDHPALAEA